VATENINIVVAQRGAQTVRRELEDIGVGADRAGRSVALLQKALGVIGLGFGLGQLQQAVDAYTNLSNRLRLVSTDSYNLAQLQEAVFQSAQRTRTPYEALAQLYSRTALNAKALGLSQQELLDVTESVAQAFKISGATSAEASGSIIQFTQGLAQGTLRGQELNSVLEQAPRLAQAIASGMGVGVYELKRLGEQGKITAEQIIDALKKAAPELDAEFAKLRPTIDDAFTVLNTGFMRTIGQIDQATGASAGLAQVMITLGSNTELMTAALAGLTIVLTAAFLPAIGSAIVAAGALTVALLANPLTWIAVAIAGLVLFGDQLKVSADGAISLLDWLKAAAFVILDALTPAIRFLGATFSATWEVVSATWGKLGQFFAENFDGLVELAGIFYRVYVSIFSGLVQAIIAVFQNLPAAIEAVFKNAMNAAIDIVEGALNGIAGAINVVLDAVKLPTIPPADLQDFKFKLSEDALEVAGVIGGAFEQGFKDGDAAAQKGLKAVSDTLDAINEQAKIEAIDRGMRGRGLQPPDGTLPETPGTVIPRDKTDAKAAKEEANRLKALLKDIKGAQGELEQGQRDLNKLLASGAITIEEYNKKLRELKLAALDAGTTLGEGLQTGLMKVQDRLNDVAKTAENLVVNAFQNMEDALVEFVTTGKLDFSNFVNSLLADLARLAIQKAILGPIAGALGGIFGFASGGVVSGPGTGTSDSILARLSNGEFVVNADSTRQFLPLLEAINNKKSRAFATGGLAGSVPAPPVPLSFGGSSRTNVTVLDQRGSGARAKVTRKFDADGNEQVRVIIRDEVNKLNEKTRPQRRREVRAFVSGDKAVGNL
jgi:tape measure domain-containing protein